MVYAIVECAVGGWCVGMVIVVLRSVRCYSVLCLRESSSSLLSLQCCGVHGSTLSSECLVVL